eukprot:9511163-Karenia_brevis.AAC.1
MAPTCPSNLCTALSTIPLLPVTFFGASSTTVLPSGLSYLIVLINSLKDSSVPLFTTDVILGISILIFKIQTTLYCKSSSTSF